MHRQNSILIAKYVAVLSAVPVILYAYSVGAPQRSTGAPGDQTCARATCHVGTAVNSSNGRVEIAYSGGTSYVPGQQGKFTVTITDTTATRFGFQASARLVSNLENGQAGTLVPLADVRVSCGDGGELPCRATQLVQFVTHAPARTTNVFEFDWTPPAAGAGDVRIYVAGNAANGNGTPTGDRIYTANVLLTPQAGGGTQQRPSVSSGGVANTWSAQPGVATNTWISIFGTNFTTDTRSWDGSPEFATGKLPLSLNGVSVTIGSRPAPVYFISPTQINVLVPADDQMGNLPLVVRNASGESAPVTVARTPTLPGLLTVSQGSGLRVVGRLNENANIVLGLPTGANARPFRPGDVVQFYATGLGPTNPVIATDSVVSTPAALVNTPTIRINDVPVEILGSVLVGSGLYQINGRVPNVPNGDQSVILEIGGVRSPDSIRITVQQ